jgi:hypothetical protein
VTASNVTSTEPGCGVFHRLCGQALSTRARPTSVLSLWEHLSHPGSGVRPTLDMLLMVVAAMGRAGDEEGVSE